MIASLGRDLVRLLLPNSCVACDTPGTPATADADALLCGLCRSRLATVVPGCARCAQPLPPIGPCRFCATWDTLDTLQSAVWLDARARSAVHALKYAGTRAVAEPMAELMVRRTQRAPGLLVPVPLGAARLRSRGFNQAEQLARALQTRWELPLVTSCLSRARDTRTQTALSPSARRANVTGAFAASGPAKGAASAVILVDDVLTTGATLLAAAAALRAVGWGPIRAVTFARAEPWGRRITS